jgi:hypothetical protein
VNEMSENTNKALVRASFDHGVQSFLDKVIHA